MDPKTLKKLAKACRDAGISHFKNAEIEFTLTDSTPVKPNRRKKSGETGDYSPQGEVESDTLTGDALLFWSSQGLDKEPTGEA